MELGIDTSTRYASVALARDGQTLGETTWLSQQNHTVELLPAIQDLLRRADASIKELNLIVVAKGPGNFSGLRVGLSLAKGLAQGLSVPVIGIPTLLLEAVPYLGLDVPVYSVLDAGRGDLIWASFIKQGETFSQVTAEQVTDLDTLCGNMPAVSLLCGEQVSSRSGDFRSRLRRTIQIVDLSPPTRRAAHLIGLGLHCLEQVGSGELSVIEPIYARAPTITAPRGFPGTSTGGAIKKASPKI